MEDIAVYIVDGEKHSIDILPLNEQEYRNASAKAKTIATQGKQVVLLLFEKVETQRLINICFNKTADELLNEGRILYNSETNKAES